MQVLRNRDRATYFCNSRIWLVGSKPSRTFPRKRSKLQGILTHKAQALQAAGKHLERYARRIRAEHSGAVPVVCPPSLRFSMVRQRGLETCGVIVTSVPTAEKWVQKMRWLLSGSNNMTHSAKIVSAAFRMSRTNQMDNGDLSTQPIA